MRGRGPEGGDPEWPGPRWGGAGPSQSPGEGRGRSLWSVVGRGWVLRGGTVIKEFRSACLSPGRSSAASWGGQNRAQVSPGTHVPAYCPVSPASPSTSLLPARLQPTGVPPPCPHGPFRRMARASQILPIKPSSLLPPELPTAAGWLLPRFNPTTWVWINPPLSESGQNWPEFPDTPPRVGQKQVFTAPMILHPLASVYICHSPYFPSTF